MTTLKLLVGTAVVFSMLAGPAMARRDATLRPAQSIYCATREMGNPHSRLCDYNAWSQWRRLGSWDATLDNACMANPAFVPGECGLATPGNAQLPTNIY